MPDGHAHKMGRRAHQGALCYFDLLAPSIIDAMDHRLENLLRHLSTLPDHLSDHPTVYPFNNFSIAPHEIEHYGTPQGALNHRLELVFGSRYDSRAIQFRGRGPSLVAIINVFKSCITGEEGENILLWKWVEDLTHGAIECIKSVRMDTVLFAFSC